MARFTVRVPLPQPLVDGLRRHFPGPGEPPRPANLPWPGDPMRGEYQRLWAFVDREALGVCDGESVHIWLREWSGSPARSLVIAGNGIDADIAEMTEPRLVPVAGLGEGRLLLLLKGYTADRKFVCRPVVCDLDATPAFRVLEPRGRDAIRGTEPRHVVVASDAMLAWLVGEYDAGADIHVDDFIMVTTSHLLDLVAGTFTRAESVQVKNPRPVRLYTAGLFESCACGRIGELRDQPAVRLVDGALEIKMRTREGPAHGAVVVPLARPLADPKWLRSLVVAVADGPRVLVVDATGDELTVHHTLFPDGSDVQ